MPPDSDLRSELEASSSLYTLWLDGALVDAELVASDGAVLPVHQVVLASASAFFRALFTGVWRQQQHPQPPGGLPRFTLGGLDGASLQLLLHAVYSGRLPLTAEGSAEEAALLLGAANYTEVLPVKAACCRFLRRQLSLETVAHTLSLAAAHDCAELLADACRFFEGHFQQLLKSPRAAASLAVLPPDLLRDLLGSDGLSLGSELDVARAALLWAGADPAQRAPLLAELLPAARLPPRQLLAAAAAGGLAGPAGDALLQLPAELQVAWGAAAEGCRERPPQPPSTPPQGGAERAQLGSAFVAACQQLDSQQAAAGACGVGREAALVAYRPRLSCPTGLIMAGGLDDGWRPLRTVELYDAHSDTWAPGPVMPAPCQFAAGALVGGQTLVVEGAAHAPHVLAFDRQARRWEQRAPPRTPRVNMAVAALEGQLFVLGGRAGIGKGAAVLTEVETFDPATDSWRRAAPMCAPRTSLAAAALGGRLYAVGGQDARSTHDSCECYEPGAGRWLPLGARLAQPRKYLGLAAAGGRLIAVGGMTGTRMRLHTAEALDPREGRWQALPPMSAAASSCGAAALHGSVYVVGGNVGQEIHENHAGVEAWVEAAGRWRACAAISHGRSGLSVAPF